MRRVSIITIVLTLGLLFIASRHDPAHIARAATCPSRPTSVDALVTRGSLNVWYASDRNEKAKATGLAAELVKIAGKLDPLPAPVAEDSTCDQGGTAGQIDFYLVDGQGVASALPTARNGVYSGFAALPRELAGLDLYCFAAELYFNLQQFRYGIDHVRDSRWWYGGTATWGAYLYDPNCPLPLLAAERFMKQGARQSLVSLNSPVTAPQSWLWPLYVQKKHDDGFVRKVFETMQGTNQTAEQATRDFYKKTAFPEFALTEFNKGTVDLFKQWKATKESVKVEVAKASLEKKPLQEADYDVVVQPGGSYHLLVEVLDVNTRFLEIDVSDFTRQAGDGAKLRVLLQPTMGPNPKATADDWDTARRENWDSAKKKRICRDDGEKEDVQQVLLAFSNNDWSGDPIKAKITVRSEAICAWAVTGKFDQAGSPGPDPVPDNIDSSATGTFKRDLQFKLQPVEEPILCKGAKAPCLPLVGNQLHSVSWSIDVSVDDPDERTTSTGHAEGRGARVVQHVEKPGAGQAPPSALFQEMEWDPTLQEFRPIFYITFIDFVSKRLGQPNTIRVAAPVANLSWNSVLSAACDDGSDVVTSRTNNHGRESYSESGTCSSVNKTYGLNGPLVFSGMPFAAFTKEDPSNPRGSGVCTIFELYAPYNFLSGGPCLQVSPEPYTTELATALGFSGNKVGPDRIEPPDGYPQVGVCDQTNLPCEILASAMGYEYWPMELVVAINLKRVPKKD